ncbi:MAG: hypothetical protein ACTSR2_00565 [Candidatus Hodarchaeales archaeon]
MKKKVGILLFEQWHGRENVGSSRIRGHWLIKYWPEAEVFQQGGKYDVVIFQKCYWPEYVRAFNGIKIFDLCDPDWLDTLPIKEVIDYCDAVTTSTEALRDEVQKFTDKPVIFIPDRQDLEFHNKQKVHKGRAKKVCWYGYSHNAKVLDKAIWSIKSFGLELVVISNLRPFYQKADKNIKWELETINDEILKCDFVVMPPDTRPRGRFKSNNKITKAWALGMPVATNIEELKRFLDPEERKKEAKKRLKEVKEKYDVRLSVKEFKDLINQISYGNKRRKSNSLR